MDVQSLSVVFSLNILDLDLNIGLEGLVLAQTWDSGEATNGLRCYMHRLLATLAHELKEVLCFVPHIILFHLRVRKKLFKRVVELIAVGRRISHNPHCVTNHFCFDVAV